VHSVVKGSRPPRLLPRYAAQRPIPPSYLMPSLGRLYSSDSDRRQSVGFCRRWRQKAATYISRCVMLGSRVRSGRLLILETGGRSYRYEPEFIACPSGATGSSRRVTVRRWLLDIDQNGVIRSGRQRSTVHSCCAQSDAPCIRGESGSHFAQEASCAWTCPTSCGFCRTTGRRNHSFSPYAGRSVALERRHEIRCSLGHVLRRLITFLRTMGFGSAIHSIWHGYLSRVRAPSSTSLDSRIYMHSAGTAGERLKGPHVAGGTKAICWQRLAEDEEGGRTFAIQLPYARLAWVCLAAVPCIHRHRFMVLPSQHLSSDCWRRWRPVGTLSTTRLVDPQANPFAVLSLIVAPAILTSCLFRPHDEHPAIGWLERWIGSFRSNWRNSTHRSQIHPGNAPGSMSLPRPKNVRCCSCKRYTQLLRGTGWLCLGRAPFASRGGSGLRCVPIPSVRILEVVAVLAVAVGRWFHGSPVLERASAVTVLS